VFNAISSSPAHSLTDFEVQALLHYRTLFPTAPCCRFCGLSNYRGHAETCQGRTRCTIGRHETIKHSLAGALRWINDISVTEEPFIRNTTRRNDIEVRYEGDSIRTLPTEQYNLRVSSMTAASTASDYAIRHKADDDRPVVTVLNVIQRILAGQARRKVRALPNRPESLEPPVSSVDTPFVPLIFSSGGVPESLTWEKIKEWRAWGIKPTFYSWTMMSVAVRIARARGRTFRLGE
jgi:hypothetical protein